MIYETSTSLDPADGTIDGDNTDSDIYRWTAATQQNECLTCGVAHADVLDPAAVSEDGSHVYFSSASQLADAPGPASPSAPNTYVWQQGQPIRFVASTDGVIAKAANGGYVTPNGNVLLFESSRAELNAQTGSDNGGHWQDYRFDDTDGSISCISCPQGAPATRDVPTELAQGSEPVMSQVRPASDDGRIVFFVTSDALVTEDRNGGPDIYEWHDGVVHLITNGAMNYPPGTRPHVVSSSPDGHDVLFTDFARLTFDAQDDSIKLYDARVNGGFEPPPPPPPVCHGECRGAPQPPPSLGDPASGTLAGSGNPKAGSALRFTVAAVTAAQRAQLVRTGRLTLAVRVGGGGRLEAFAQASIGGHSRVVALTARSTRRPALVRLTLRLSRAARVQLARAGRLRLGVTVSFSNAADTRRLVIPLRAARAHVRKKG